MFLISLKHYEIDYYSQAFKTFCQQFDVTHISEIIYNSQTITQCVLRTLRI